MKKNVFFELRDFLILWGSQAVSTLGTAMTNFALVVWVFRQKGTASSITLLSVFSFLPSILKTGTYSSFYLSNTTNVTAILPRKSLAACTITGPNKLPVLSNM